MGKLKPCPFCCAHKMEYADIYEINTVWTAEGYVQYECDVVRGPLRKTLKEAIKAWNTRGEGG